MSIDTDRRVRELEKMLVLLEARLKKLEEAVPQGTLTLKAKAKKIMDSMITDSI